MLLTVAATAFTFTACNDDNDGPEPFKSELIGSYKPTPITMTIPDVVDDPSDFYFILLPTWSDPENIPGEIVCRGPNVMLGYYKNEEATAEVVDKDGWLHTGDLALMDAEGNVTIKGRSKNMLLGPNGQNIYPEEIEDKLNNLPYVAESIIVQQNEKLVGLVYPDFDDAFAHGLNNDDIERVMEENRVALNAELPAYSQISKMKIYPEEFEKTPKKSIKRFLYQEAKG